RSNNTWYCTALLAVTCGVLPAHAAGGLIIAVITILTCISESFATLLIAAKTDEFPIKAIILIHRKGRNSCWSAFQFLGNTQVIRITDVVRMILYIHKYLSPSGAGHLVL
ncbi:MAG: hypothetical protein MUO76_23635, partial [Anaerolineaceae bacterium]|nr:hypothetical protein [Anaerolineaceae bacterium]